MKSSYHWVWQLLLNISWVEKYPDPTENKTFTLCCGQAIGQAAVAAVAHFFQIQTSGQRYPEKEAIYSSYFSFTER